MISDEDALRVLEKSAQQTTNGMWIWPKGYLTEPPFPHTEREALDITKVCLSLGVPVTDVPSGRWFLRMIERIERLEGLASTPVPVIGFEP